MRFFIEQEQKHSPWMMRLYRLLRVVFIPDIEPLVKNQECLEAIQNTLKKGNFSLHFHSKLGYLY